MDRPVMDAAKRHDKFIAGLTAEGTRLREAEVVWIRMFSAAHQA